MLFRALVARREAVHDLLVSTLDAVQGAHRPGPAEPRGPQARADPPGERRRRAQQERGQHRQQPAADGAVLPRLRQHARHRSLVRHLHPELPARPAGWAVAGWASGSSRRPRRHRRAARRPRRSSMFGGEERKTLTAHFPRTVSVYEGSDVRVLGVPDRHRRHGRAVRHRRRGDHVVRRRDRGARRRQGRDHRAVGRRRPLRPAHAGVRRQGEVLADGADARPRTRPRCRSSWTRSTTAWTSSTWPSARRAPTATARCPTCSRPPPRTSAARASSSTRPSRTSAGSARPRPTTRRSCSAPPARSRASSARSPRTTRPCASSTSRWPTSSTMLEGERGELQASLKNLAVALSEVSTLRQGQPRLLGRNIKGLNRVAKVLVKQRGALDEMLSTAPLALNNLVPDLQPAGRHARHPLQPRRDRRPARRPTRRRCCAASSARPTRSGQVCDAIKADRLPGLRRGAALGQAPARRPAQDALRPHPRRPRGGGAMKRADGAPVLLVARPGRAAHAAATSTSTSCRCPAAPTSATTRSRSRSSSPTSSTWCPSRRSRSTTSASAR